jgi:hypothetical protein
MAATRKRKQKWGKGTLFAVPLDDGSFTIGLVLAVEPDALNSFIGAFYLHRLHDEFASEDLTIDFPSPMAVQFVTRDLLDSGVWKVIACLENVPDPGAYLPLTEMKRNRFVGVTVRGSGIVRKFLNAIYGLGPWNAYPRMGEDYFDGFLLHPRFKPGSD